MLFTQVGSPGVEPFEYWRKISSRKSGNPMCHDTSLTNLLSTLLYFPGWSTSLVIRISPLMSLLYLIFHYIHVNYKSPLKSIGCLFCFLHSYHIKSLPYTSIVSPILITPNSFSDKPFLRSSAAIARGGSLTGSSRK